MVIINIAVMNISMKRPRATLTPGANEVLTLRVPGVRASIIAAPMDEEGGLSGKCGSEWWMWLDLPVIPPRI